MKTKKATKYTVPITVKNMSFCNTMYSRYFLFGLTLTRPNVFHRYDYDSSNVYRAINSYHCRNLFNGAWERQKTVHMVLGTNRPTNYKRVIRFVNHVETALKLKTRSEFSLVQLNNRIPYFTQIKQYHLLKVKVPSFWCQSKLHKSLFTALLKSGFNYNTANHSFSSFCRVSKYFNNTYPALSKFMKGYTAIDRSISTSKHWKDTMSKKENLQLMNKP